MKQMKRIVTAFVIGLSLISGTAQADYLLAEDKLKFGKKNYFLIIAAEKSTGLKPDTFIQDRLNIQKKYEKKCNDQVMVWHTGLISSTKPKWGKGYWFVFSFVSDSKFSVSSANKNSCVLKGSYVKSGTPIDYEERLTKTVVPSIAPNHNLKKNNRTNNTDLDRIFKEAANTYEIYHIAETLCGKHSPINRLKSKSEKYINLLTKQIPQGDISNFKDRAWQKAMEDFDKNRDPDIMSIAVILNLPSTEKAKKITLCSRFVQIYSQAVETAFENETAASKTKAKAKRKF